MPKVYDPILCMMVDKPTKARDESYIVRGRKYKVVKRDGDNVTVIGPDGKVTKMHIDFLMSEGKKAHDSASALDKAIKCMDADVELVKTIASKNGYAVHIVNGQYGKRIVLTFKGESYKNPHMWLGEANEANKSKALEMLNELAKK